MNKYCVKLQTITPLHIGNGEKYSPLEYFIEGRYINIVDINSIFDDIEKAAKEEGIKIIDELCKRMVSKISSKPAQNTKEFFTACGISNISKYVKKKLQTDIETQKEIRKFINQNGKYYVPGSSIKGVIRTAYLFNYFDNNKNIEELVRVLGDRNIKPEHKSEKLNEIVFGPLEKDFFKYLHVEDSHLIKDEYMKIIETRRYNIYKHQRGIPICLEVIKENTEISFGIRIQDKFEGKIENIKDSIRNLTMVVCDYEIKNNKNPGFIQDFYGKILNSMKNPNEIYLNVGFGGGYLPKTIYLLLWKYKKNIDLIKELLPTRNDKKKGIYQRVDYFEDFPRTKTLYNNKPIGWAKLNFKYE